MSGTLAEILESITSLSNINYRNVAELVRTTPETVSRWLNGRVAPQKDGLQRVLQLQFFLSELSEFYSPEEAHIWLFSPNKALDRATPYDLIKEGRTEDVFALLEQLRSGAYT